MPVEPNDRIPNRDQYTILRSSRQEQFDAVVPYVRGGLRRGEKCLYVASDDGKPSVLDALADDGVDVDSAVEAGDLAVLPPREVFPTEDGPDADRTLDALRSAIEVALDADYDHVRVTVEMSWTRDCSLDPESVAACETELDELCADYPCTVLRAYDRDRIPPESLDDALATRPPLLSESRQSASNGSQRALAALNDVARAFEDAEEREVWELVADAVVRVADVSTASVWTFDPETGVLEPTVVRPESDGAVEGADDPPEAVWEAFGDDESKPFPADPDESVAAHADDRGRAGVAVPVGAHGVVLVESAGDGLGEVESEFVEALAGNARTALESRESERELRDRAGELAVRDERVERLDRIVDAYGRVSRAVVNATTREEVLATVCDELVDVGSVEFAWVGATDPDADTITPRQRAGRGQGYLDALSVADDWAEREPTGRAASAGEPRREATVRTELPLANWRKQALKRGFRSCISLPLEFDGCRYGVLSMYSGEPGTFDEEVRAALDDLGSLVAHAISAIERKNALISDSVTEIELLIRDPDHVAVRLAERTDCHLELDGIAPGTDRTARLFVEVRDAPPEAVRTTAKQAQSVADVRLVDDSEDGRLYELTVSDSGMTATLLDHGAVPTEMDAGASEARLTVHVPKNHSVREFLDMFTAKYPDSELLARRERDRPSRTRRDFRRAFEEDASERQLEILETAYFSGYFEWPRDRTGEEIAESLGVTQPTVNRHLRAVQRTLLSKLFGED